MASKSLTFDLFGRDRTASRALKGVGSEADRLNATMRRVGAGIAVGLGVAAAAATAFGIQSVKAFADAQAQQEKLNFAYEKFPAIADVTRASYDALNAALMAKTGFDDDAIASGQGVLAQFGLTGKQLQKLTPLLLDYARASGQDVVSAAEDVGKAMLGQGRALKGIGIDFQDAGSVAANYDQVLAGLTTNVSGYAEQFGTTAAGKFEILTAKWGEFQEKVGSALLPGLEKLMAFVDSDVMPQLQGFADWFATDGVNAFKGVIDSIKWIIDNKETAVVAIGALTVAFWGMSAALDANPIGAFILLLAGGIAWWGSFTGMITGSIGSIGTSFRFFQFAVELAMANAAVAVNNFLAPLNAVIDTINRLTGMNIGKIGVTVPGITVPNFGAPSAGPAGGRVGGRSSVNPSRTTTVRAFAEGGLVKGGRGGVLGMIGEKNYDELVVPLKNGTSGIGGTNVYVTVQGAVGSEDFLAKTVVRAIQNAQSRGQVPRGALA